MPHKHAYNIYTIIFTASLRGVPYFVGFCLYVNAPKVVSNFHLVGFSSFPKISQQNVRTRQLEQNHLFQTQIYTLVCHPLQQ